MKWCGSFAAPSTVPTTEPAVAAFESVSHPPCTANPTVAVKSPSPHSKPAVIRHALLWTRSETLSRSCTPIPSQPRP